MKTTTQRLVWFPTGIALLALLLGFLVGASQTPVAGVAVTAAFGLAAAALGFLQSSTTEKYFDLVAARIEAAEKPADRPRHEQLLAALDERVSQGLERTGRALVLFAVVFALGILGGALVRVSGWPHRTKEARRFPWAAGQAPALAENAVAWIGIQERLREAGFTQEQIEELYRMWKKTGDEKPLSNVVPKQGDSPLFQLVPGTKKGGEGIITAVPPDPSKAKV